MKKRPLKLTFFSVIILAFRSFSLPGALDGLKAYTTPKWENLLTLDIWKDAAKQIIFSLGPACGCVITLSSYNEFNRDCHRDAVTIAGTTYMHLAIIMLF